MPKGMNNYRKGATVERKAVNDHIAKGALFAGRFAGSKMKGCIKIDVIALYPPTVKETTADQLGFYTPPILVLEQYKKSKGKFVAERKAFEMADIPVRCDIVRKFIEVKCK